MKVKRSKKFIGLFWEGEALTVSGDERGVSEHDHHVSPVVTVITLVTDGSMTRVPHQPTIRDTNDCNLILYLATLSFFPL